MSKWAGKFVIGLTGNIGTGKSVVRRMLEQHGSFSIDADALAHRAITKGSAGYHRVIDQFGSWLLDERGNIDRSALGTYVFSTNGALAKLESIIHPVVGKAVETIISRARQSVIVIEAIKLLEANMDAICDSIWVTYTSHEIQLHRLMESRALNEQQALLRISAQPPQEDKLVAANVIINNLSTFEDTWKQVSDAWEKSIPANAKQMARAEKKIVEDSDQQLKMVIADLRQAAEISKLISKADTGKPVMEHESVMRSFSQNLFLLIYAQDQIVSAITFRPDDMVACIKEIFLDSSYSGNHMLTFFIDNIDIVAKLYQCEVIFVSIPRGNNTLCNYFTSAGFIQSDTDNLDSETWIETARKTYGENKNLYIKPLVLERVVN